MFVRPHNVSLCLSPRNIIQVHTHNTVVLYSSNSTLFVLYTTLTATTTVSASVSRFYTISHTLIIEHDPGSDDDAVAL